MINKFNQPLYHLVFGTNNERGIEVMKNAIWSVDKTGNYRFSDRFPTTQQGITDFYDSKWEHWVPRAAGLVYQKFSEQEVPLSLIKKFVVIDTIYPFKKSILRYLESSGPSRIVSVTVPGKKRRKGTFRDDCWVKFL